MAEKYVNYVNLADGTDLLDLRHDSIKPEFLLLGETAHDATGKPIVGEYEPEIVESGQCGENVFWELYENGLLVISGSGETGFDGVHSPFRGRKDIADVIIKDGITNICERLFTECSVEHIIIPNSVKSIDSRAFSMCENLKEIIIPSGCTTIGTVAFLGCYNLSKIVIADSVISIGEVAFMDVAGEYAQLDVFYAGKKEQWNGIEIGSNNERLLSATLHCEYKEEQEVTYPTIVKNGSYEITAEEGKTMSRAIVEVDVQAEGGSADSTFWVTANLDMPTFEMSAVSHSYDEIAQALAEGKNVKMKVLLYGLTSEVAICELTYYSAKGSSTPGYVMFSIFVRWSISDQYILLFANVTLNSDNLVSCTPYSIELLDIG